MLGLKAYKRGILRFAAVGAVAIAAGACSSLPTAPDWVDPTNWFGDDSSAPADNGQTPDLASIPDKPAATTPDDQKNVSESLAADRTHATYSADALRGGTEAAAPPPPNVEPAQVASDVLPGSENDKSSRPKKSAAAPAPAPVRTAQVDRSVSREPTGPAMPGTLPAPTSSEMVASVAPASSGEPSSSLTAGTEAAPAPAPSVAPAPVATDGVVPPPAPVQSASLAEPTPAPAPVTVPAPAPVKVARAPVMPPMQRVASIPPSDAALGFKPSSAPPLDPSVSQFVAPSIIQHYRQTASEAGMYSSGVPVRVARAKAPRKVARRHSSGSAMGGPEHMTGAVVANLDALQQPAAPPVEAAAPVYTDAQGSTATAVVYFPGDATRLSAKSRLQIRAAVEQFKAAGEQGYIKVVGHSSSRTPNMSAERHAQVVFEKSQLRADAVAQEIIREGVPAAKVLVEAVGDSQPVYYESMPKGEDGNRRAEIFLQG